MLSDDWPEWLPADWTMQIKKIGHQKIKCYVDSQGHKCYSKPQVFDYLTRTGRKQAHENTDNANGSTLDLSVAPENEVIGSSPGGPPAKLATRSSRKKSLENNSSVVSDSSQNLKRYGKKKENSNFEEVITTTPADGLPPGWIKEIRTKIFATHKRNDPFYTDPVSGYIFRSKLDALRFLEAGDVKVCAMRPKMKDKDGNEVENNSSVVSDSSQNLKRSGNKKENSNFEEVITTTPADGLPPGWIKEIRTKIFATHKRNDPFYTDPVSGYIFCSKLDALRFLETGDVNVCAMRPKMKDKDGNEVYVRTNAVPKPVKTTGKQLVEDKQKFNPDPCVIGKRNKKRDDCLTREIPLNLDDEDEGDNERPHPPGWPRSEKRQRTTSSSASGTRKLVDWNSKKAEILVQKVESGVEIKRVQRYKQRNLDMKFLRTDISTYPKEAREMIQQQKARIINNLVTSYYDV